MFKKMLSSLTVAATLIAMVIPAFATDVSVPGDSDVPVTLNAEAITFSVTVPTGLAIDVDAEGNVTTATDDCKIVNNSYGAVVVSNVEIYGQNDWEIVNFDRFDIKSEKVNSKKIAFEINNEKTMVTGLTFNAENWPKMDGKNDTNSDELIITYNAKVPAQSSKITKESVANVIFTIGWDI